VHTYSDSERLQAVKRQAWQALQQLPGADLAGAARRWLADGLLCVVGHPVHTLQGRDAACEGLYAPLLRALPDLERRVDLFFGGHWDGHIDGGAGWWVTCTGHYLGTMRAPLWGIPAHGQPVYLRFGEFHRLEGEGEALRIVESRVLFDLPGLARQVGRPVLPSATGLEGLVPGPRHGGGVLLGAQSGAESQASFDLVMAMIGGLGRYDRQDLQSMGMARFWHPDMMWYGPSGIGTSRSIAGFEQHHQRPFLTALPDRKGGHHRARFAEGAFVASTGWPSVRATHAGPYLGVPASGKAIGLRVMDWWRAEHGLLVENWVLLDLPDLFLQVGVDILARAAD
jgi:predicted ester cyclase